MSKDVFTRCARPYLFNGFKRSPVVHSTRALSLTSPCLAKQPKQHDVTHDYEKRVAQLEARKSRAEWYPRIGHVAPVRSTGGRRITRRTVLQHGAQLAPGETYGNTCAPPEEVFVLAGRTGHAPELDGHGGIDMMQDASAPCEPQDPSLSSPTYW